MESWLLAAAGAVLVFCTLAFCLYARRLGHALGVLDVPDGRRKRHGHVTPLVGGLAVLVPVLALILGQALTSDFAPLYGSLGFALAAFLALGFVDDRRHVRPLYRLLVSVALCAAVLWLVPGLRIDFLTFSFLGYPIFVGEWAVVFTILCLVGLQNAINMADGKNGLVLCLTLFWVVMIAAYAPAHLLPLLAVFGAGLLVALVFNWRGRLFLGDSGTYGISILVGLLAIHVYSIRFDVLRADAVALWFLVPVVDCLRLMIRRGLEGNSPFSSDRDHLHHILAGSMPWHRALPVYFALVAVPNLLAYVYPDATPLWALTALTVYAGIVVGLYRRRAALGRLTTT